MRILVLSDTHLSLPFEPQKYHLLESLINEASTVILNGDFWEGYSLSFDEFVKSPWNNLFPLLKKKKTVYLYGNHDKKEYADNRVRSFCVYDGLRYEMNVQGRHFIFEHGDRVAFRLEHSLNFLPRCAWTFNALNTIQALFFRIFGTQGARFFFSHLNNDAKAAIKKELRNDPNAVFVFGHTHCQEIDLENKIANGGIFTYGFGQYLTIDEKGNIAAHNKRY